MLAELNIRPRTQYLARIENPNAVLAEAMPQGVKGREDYDPATYGEGGHGGHGHGHGHDDHGDHGDSHNGEEATSHDDH